MSWIETESGNRAEISSELAQGGQARVYLLRGQRRVAKIYHKMSDEMMIRQQNRLKAMIQSGPPAAAFVWPLEIIRRPSLGYTMPYHAGYLELDKLARSKYLALADLRARLRICYRLVNAFASLHLRGGYAYCDLSESNILCRPTDGEVLIIDNDNLWVDGVGMKGPVYGTYRCMAPEIEAAVAAGADPQPTIESDLHSLAVVIFRTLLFHHPLLGDEVHEDFEKERNALGAGALYIYNTRDRRNRYTQHARFGGVPVTVLPASTQRLFADVFVSGLHSPALRVRETNWKRELINLLDSLVRCPNKTCIGKQTFLQVGEQSSSLKRTTCVWCRTSISGYKIMRFLDPASRRVLRYKVLYDGDYLTAHHCKARGAYDFSADNACGQVVQDSVAGLTLRNISGESLTYRREPAKAPESFPPQKRVPMRSGYSVTFGAGGLIGEVV